MKKIWILALAGAIIVGLLSCGQADQTETVPAETEGSNMISVTYYHGDKWGNKLVEETGTIEKLTAQNLIDLLAETGAIPEGIRVLNFQLTGDIITLNLSHEMQEAAEGKGSSGEYILMGSLVNTLLTAYDAEGIDLTSAGARIQTGHDYYDYILEFYE